MENIKVPEEFKVLISNRDKRYVRQCSIDCVVFGFAQNQMKVLLVQWKYLDKWTLPGGFIHQDEPIDQAANRILKERTGLEKLYLKQFATFGDPHRSRSKDMQQMLDAMGIFLPEDNWLFERFISIGYLALVNFDRVTPNTDLLSSVCGWHNLSEIPDLMFDHTHIIQTALGTLRKQLYTEPVGKYLLPEKFTMPELQKLYETILGEPLDRRNFAKKISSMSSVKRLKERKSGGAHRAPYLYTFI
ncbi:NUDIX domain-containing protein [Rapidithrix thailandica]|uniref:NUDIX domain-containing protein n=1 Tax=Rapidithrix thailandica TaxID=413964 RepID=A0AAW9S0G4_9BACT